MGEIKVSIYERVKLDNKWTRLITYHLLRAYSKDAPIPFARPIAALKRLESVPQRAAVEVVTEK